MARIPESGSSVSATRSSAAPPAEPMGDVGAVRDKIQTTPIYTQVLNELNVNVNIDQLRKRQQLITEVEEALTAKFGCPNRLVTYVLRFGHARTLMSTEDVPSLEAALSSVAGAEQINLLLHSPGGDGTIAEKLVEMCRTRLTGKDRKFRVIVPNLAKSAATILALGADEIMMGHLSELGPIDPQIAVSVSGMVQWVSAFAFVEARDKLVEAIGKAVARKESHVALLQQLAGLNIPFTDEMENQIKFSENTAVALLDKYMLRDKVEDDTQRRSKAKEIAGKLLSKQLFPVHGHYIGGTTAKQLGMTVEILDKDDVLWKLIWSYYIRCEVQMNIPLAPGLIKTKLFESGGGVSLVAQSQP